MERTMCIFFLKIIESLRSYKQIHNWPKWFILSNDAVDRINRKVSYCIVQWRLGWCCTFYWHYQKHEKPQIRRKLFIVILLSYNFSTPWFVNEQHAGFIQLYSGVSFVLVKGASHQVPQSKRAEAFDLFHAVLTSQGSQEEFKNIILNWF